MTNCAGSLSLLSGFHKNLLLSVCPKGTTIINAKYFREGYVPGPIRVVTRFPNGSQQILVLRLARHGSIEGEACLFSVLAPMELAVPQVLAGPKADPHAPNGSIAAVYSFLEGCNLQELSERSTDDCTRAMQLVVEGATRLAALTYEMQSKAEVEFLPVVTLSDQLESLLQNAGPWLHESVFSRAVDALRPVLDQVADQPVFTGGDYQPANFLTDGTNLTGFVDFENARYQDFLFGFAKYPIYDLHPMNKAGFVHFLVEQANIERWQFDIRVALGCLTTLQREIPVTGKLSNYRMHVLSLLSGALSSINKRNRP